MFIKNVTNNKVSDVLFSYSLTSDPSNSTDWYDWCLENEDVVVECNTVQETNIIEIEPVNDKSENQEAKGLPISVITGHGQSP